MLVVDDPIKYVIALRIRPKLTTAIGAILALMPLALGIELGAQMQQSPAIAVIGAFVAGIPLYYSCFRVSYDFIRSAVIAFLFFFFYNYSGIYAN